MFARQASISIIAGIPAIVKRLAAAHHPTAMFFVSSIQCHFQLFFAAFPEELLRVFATSPKELYRQNAAYSGTVFFPSAKPKFFVESFTAYAG